MGVPLPDMEPVENASAEALLSSLKTIGPGERRKHASVFNYWLSIRGNRPFPPIRDLDPLEISDAGPWSILLEMIGGGEDAVVRHFGQAIKNGIEVEKIGEAPSPSLLACIHAKLPIVAACKEAFAFEESFDTDNGPSRCWVTLLPLGSNGTWIDYVYGYVSLDGAEGPAEAAAVEEEPDIVGMAAGEDATEDEPASEVSEDVSAVDAMPDEAEQEPFQVELKPYGDEAEAAEEPSPVVEMVPQGEDEMPEPEPAGEPAGNEPPAVAEVESELESEPVEFEGQDTRDEPQPTRAGFSSKLLGSIASSFYGKVTQAPDAPIEDYPEPESEADYVAAAEASAEPEHEAPAEEFAEPEQAAVAQAPDEPAAEPAKYVEGTLQSKLTDVRSLAAEAREAQIRSNIALYEGLSAAYDFALDAEEEPEEYLRLVEAQGLKIQLRSPMKPVVKLAFDGMCDEPTIKQLEAILAWALKNDLERGTLAERIEAEGGIGAILNGQAKAA